jgi:DNA-binding XRE family transcriptional regulator
MTLGAAKEDDVVSINEIIANATWNKRIEILRVANGWSQEQAAEQCGTTKKCYWLWESGTSYPRNNSRRAISLAFSVPVSEIFNPTLDKKAV